MVSPLSFRDDGFRDTILEGASCFFLSISVVRLCSRSSYSKSLYSFSVLYISSFSIVFSL